MGVMVEADLGDNPLRRLPNSVAGMFAIYETQAVLQRELERDERFSAYSHPEKLLLAYLAEPMRMGEIAETVGYLPSSVTAIVGGLTVSGGRPGRSPGKATGPDREGPEGADHNDQGVGRDVFERNGFGRGRNEATPRSAQP